MSSPSATPSPSGAPGPAWPSPAPLRRDAVVVAVGVALLAAAVVVSTVNSRPRGDLDLSSYAIGLLATLGLLGTALAALVRVHDRGSRGTLVVWPAAFGALATGLMILVGLDASDVSVYLAGLVVLALSAAVYTRTPGGALAVSGLVGTGVAYGKLVDDLIDVGDTDGGFIVSALVVWVFVLAVTGLGWLLPRTRALTGVVVGVFAVFSYLSLMSAIIFASALSGLLAPIAADVPTGGPEVDSYTDDTYVILLLAAALVAVWALAGYRSEHPGFKVLIVAITAGLVPLATVALALDEPGWWGLGAAVVGVMVLVGVLLGALSRGTGSAALPAGGPAYPAPSGPPSGPAGAA